MTLRFIGTTSEHGNCPTLYGVVETGEILVQGEIEADPEHLAQLRDVKPSETFVRVPRELLTRFAPRDVEPDAEQQVKEWRACLAVGSLSDPGASLVRWQANTQSGRSSCCSVGHLNVRTPNATPVCCTESGDT
ncbi:hypothetical protein MTQ01_03820 [Streptomyces sp. XM4193]|uniref:hypothetical protein n=1 Tax=Streptomyces sp. XM4193 TaxID=2929782 RepID=UPI001FF84767|nr:hypothetical protein [Streptomyces sp. XM4193]MCK1795148.1 hypothetical protein [Streptomyces sp. XM4193]